MITLHFFCILFYDQTMAISFQTCIPLHTSLSYLDTSLHRFACLARYVRHLDPLISSPFFPFVFILHYLLSQNDVFCLAPPLAPLHLPTLPWRIPSLRMHALASCCTNIRPYHSLTSYLLHLLKQKRTTPSQAKRSTSLYHHPPIRPLKS